MPVVQNTNGPNGWKALHAHLNLNFAGETGISILVSPFPNGVSEFRYEGEAQKVIDCQAILIGKDQANKEKVASSS